MTDRFPQGVCCHEAGHAVVAFSLGIRVVAVSVIFTEEKDWHGKTVTDGTPDHWKDQIVLRMAGKAAEEVFNCPADPTALLHDMLEVDSLLNRMGMSLEREGRIEEGKAHACIILEGHREQALKLIAHLVEHGHVKEPEFLRFMYGEA
jgi:hypothetical protein